MSLFSRSGERQSSTETGQESKDTAASHQLTAELASLAGTAEAAKPAEITMATWDHGTPSPDNITRMVLARQQAEVATGGSDTAPKFEEQRLHEVAERFRGVMGDAVRNAATTGSAVPESPLGPQEAVRNLVKGPTHSESVELEAAVAEALVNADGGSSWQHNFDEPLPMSPDSPYKDDVLYESRLVAPSGVLVKRTGYRMETGESGKKQVPVTEIDFIPPRSAFEAHQPDVS